MNQSRLVNSSNVPDYLKRYLGNDSSNTTTTNTTEKKKKKKKKDVHTTTTTTSRSTIKDVDQEFAFTSQSDTATRNKNDGDKKQLYTPVITNIDEYNDKEKQDILNKIGDDNDNDDDGNSYEKGTWTTVYDPNNNNNSRDLSPPSDNGRRGRSRDDDLSPPRDSGRRRRGRDDDLSPPRDSGRRNRNQSPTRDRDYIVKKEEDQDLLPPRKSNTNINVKREREQDIPTVKQEYNESIPPNQRLKMSFGGDVGLQKASNVKEQALQRQREQKELFEKADKSLLGVNAQTVYRDKHGNRQTQKEYMDSNDGNKKKDKQGPSEQEQLEWSKGRVQKEKQMEERERLENERLKPFSRFADDQDLNNELKDIDRWGDPMANYKSSSSSSSKKQTEKSSSSKDKKKKEKPKYPYSFPTNRYNIRPGYRWDGVDRSNGFEKQLFTNLSIQKAKAEDAYMWSTEDM